MTVASKNGLVENELMLW